MKMKISVNVNEWQGKKERRRKKGKGGQDKKEMPRLFFFPCFVFGGVCCSRSEKGIAHALDIVQSKFPKKPP